MPKYNFRANRGATPKAPSFQPNFLQQMMMLQAKSGQQEQQAKEAPSIAQDIAQNLPQGAPPGAQVHFGGTSLDVNPKRSLEEAQSLSGSDIISNHIDYIKSLQQDPERFRNIFQKATFRGTGQEKGKIFGFPLTYGDKEANNLKFALSDMSNRLIYLFSGKQINEEEYKRLSEALPSFIDISDPSDVNFSSLNNKLNTYQGGLNGIKQRLIKGGNYDAQYWEGPVQNTGMMGNQSTNIQKSYPSPISKIDGNKNSNDKSVQYNQLRASGLSKEEARAKVGI